MAPLRDYPDSFGAHKFSVFPHTGPASYTQVTVGPLAGGNVVTLQGESGVKFGDFVFGGITDSGQFRVEAIPVLANPSTDRDGSLTFILRWTSLVTATVGGQAQTVNVQAATATDLSAQVVRLAVVGRY